MQFILTQEEFDKLESDAESGARLRGIEANFHLLLEYSKRAIPTPCYSKPIARDQYHCGLCPLSSVGSSGPEDIRPSWKESHMMCQQARFYSK